MSPHAACTTLCVDFLLVSNPNWVPVCVYIVVCMNVWHNSGWITCLIGSLTRTGNLTTWYGFVSTPLSLPLSLSHSLTLLCHCIKALLPLLLVSICVSCCLVICWHTQSHTALCWGFLHVIPSEHSTIGMWISWLLYENSSFSYSLSVTSVWWLAQCTTYHYFGQVQLDWHICC